jgi:ribonucleoside-triphosphate reductase
MKKLVVPCEVFSRVTGYFRPISNWNDGKREEFKDRQVFSEKKSLESAQKVEAVAVH